jgi:hypothetical protein
VKTRHDKGLNPQHDRRRAISLRVQGCSYKEIETRLNLSAPLLMDYLWGVTDGK